MKTLPAGYPVIQVLIQSMTSPEMVAAVTGNGCGCLQAIGPGFSAGNCV